MIERRIMTESIRKALDEHKYLEALLQTSASLENLFFMKLLFEKGIKEELMNSWTLSRYIDWVEKMDLLDKKYLPLLRKFNQMRNCVAHTGFALPRIQNNLEKSQTLSNLILEVCDFIDSYSIQYRDIELDNEYSKFSKRTDTKFKKLFGLA